MLFVGRSAYFLERIWWRKFYRFVLGSPVLNVKYNDYLVSTRILPKLSANSTILDLGCGDGEFCNRISLLRGCLCVGIDRLPDLIERAIAVKNKYLTNTQFYNLNFENVGDTGKYDVILCMDVLEHVSEPNLLVRFMANSLADNGVILIRVPHDQDVKIFWKNQDFAYGEDKHVVSGYTLSKINELMHVHSLEVESYEYNYHYLAQLIWEISEVFWKYQVFYYLLSMPFFALLLFVEYLSDSNDKNANGITLLIRHLK